METNERGTLSGQDPRPPVSDQRWRVLSEHLSSEVERARADAKRARADLDRTEAALRKLHARYAEVQIADWLTERSRQEAEALLAKARDHIARSQPLLRHMRSVLATVQTSKFWKVRNAWFRLKQRLRLNPTGPLEDWLPEIDEKSDRWINDFPYERWMVAHQVRNVDMRRMRDVIEVMPLRPTFSVLMPVYETPETLLREAIDS